MGHDGEPFSIKMDPLPRSRIDPTEKNERCKLDPYSSGAVMFYGKDRQKPRGRVSRSTSDWTSNKTDSSETLRSGSLVTTSTSRSFQTASQLANHVPPTLASMALAQTDSTATSGHDTLIANSATMLSLLAEVSNLFSNVPYVKVVAGVVKQIIEISNVFPSLPALFSLIQVIASPHQPGEVQRTGGKGDDLFSCCFQCVARGAEGFFDQA